MTSKTTNLKNWNEFLRKPNELKKRRSRRELSSSFLYRGHADARWRLQTTLERFGGPQSWDEYYRFAPRVLLTCSGLSDQS